MAPTVPEGTPPVKILLIEDYAPLRKALTQGFVEAGFAVDAAADGEEGLCSARMGGHDVVVLDLMLPRVDGLTLLRRLREARSAVHVLILTARDTLQDRVRGLNQGADDYLVKPFAFEELLARVRALVRRRYETKSPRIKVGDLEIATDTREVHLSGERVELTAREYMLLEYLAHRVNRVVTRSMIREHLYDCEAEAASNVVDVYIGYLRRKLERPGLPRLIHTRRGMGYVLGVSG